MIEDSATIVASRAEAAHVERLRALIEDELARISLPDGTPELYEAVRYALGGGGKRLRPILLLLAAEAAGGNVEDALPAALAAEVFHTFTLVHDDIMDDAAERRGRPSVHVVWNESTAILAGDFLMGLSYELLARTPVERLAPLFHSFHRMVAAVCEGQALDEAFETRENVTAEEYLDMVSRKTGALLACVFELGGRIAGADDETVARLAQAGEALGVAFQIQDDLLDLTAEDASWGKQIGGDLVQGKRTFILLRSLECASGDDRAFFGEIAVNGGLDASLVPDARERMRALGVLTEASEEVERHSNAAVDILEGLPPSDARRSLVWLVRRLANRAR